MTTLLQTIQTWDWQLLSAIEKLHTPVLDFLMPRITALGNAGFLWILVAILLLCFPKTRRSGITLAVALLLTLVFGNLLLKPLLARPRPFASNPGLSLLIAPPSDFSFPSGHTYSSIASAIILWHCDRRFGIPALVLALLIAFSRLYLMVHFPTDVLGGILLGTLCAFLAIWLTKQKRRS